MIATKTNWLDADIPDTWYRDHFLKLPAIIESWTNPYLDLRGADLLDFGCGEGTTALGFALNYGPRRVVGVDIMPDPANCPGLARKHLGLEQLPANLSLHRIVPGTLPVTGKFDLAYAWSVFEHVDQRLVAGVLDLIGGALKPNGLLFLQIAPLYYSSEGSHLLPKIPEPWGHLSIQTDIYEARLAAACDDPAEHEALLSTYKTLNRITSDQLIDTVASCDYRILRTYTTRDEIEPPARLRAIYRDDVLRTTQVVILAQRR